MLSGSLVTIQNAYIASLVVASPLLFGLGMFLAKVGSDRILPSGIRMVVAGLVCVVMSFLLSSGSAG
jgi:VIT1/CCC1 family predicted Fe2+/Mn2+ transporter